MGDNRLPEEPHRLDGPVQIHSKIVNAEDHILCPELVPVACDLSDHLCRVTRDDALFLEFLESVAISLPGLAFAMVHPIQSLNGVHHLPLRRLAGVSYVHLSD